MDHKETARKFYESARQELIQRIQLRDGILGIYLAGVGAIFGFAFGTTPNYLILLAIPFIEIGIAILVTQHDAVIGALGNYCSNEIGKILDGDIPNGISQWDNSQSLKEYAVTSITKRFWGQFIILIMPCLIGIVLNVPQRIDKMLFIWLLSIVLTVFSTFLLINVFSWRKKVYTKNKWNN